MEIFLRLHDTFGSDSNTVLLILLDVHLVCLTDVLTRKSDNRVLAVLMCGFHTFCLFLIYC